ncbi:MAG: phosphatase PAP2 family protein [Pseudomonadota bacterium]
MTLFLRIAFVHFVTALVLLMLFRDEGLGVLGPVWYNTANMLPKLAWIVQWVVLAGIVVLLFLRANWDTYKTATINLGLAITATVMFHCSFTLIKTTIPEIVPFWADPYLANIDAWLHGGDPWRWVYAVSADWPMDFLLRGYLIGWSVPVLGFVVFLAVLDRDPERIKRFVILYSIAWLFVGHVVATAGASVGPVYYDRLIGGDRFAELYAAMAGGAIPGTNMEIIQGALWDFYADNKQALGSGISAFPSVHVSSTMVLGLYLYERSPRIGGPIGAAIVLFILFLSVYSGYHYALDGYASILIMGAAYAWLRRSAAKPSAPTATLPDLGKPQAA